MSGLRVWNSSGVLITDVETRMGRILGSVQTGAGSGSISVPGFATGTPFGIVLELAAASTQTNGEPTISISGTTLSWSFAANPGNQLIFYGVF